MKTAVHALLALALLSAEAANAQPPNEPLNTVPKVDLDRYVGKWHEIALYPNRFQAQCVADTTANYVKKPNRRIEVTNRCRKADGKMDEAIGEARLATEDGSNAKLEVRFAPGWLSWLPQVWGNYWVIELDADYQYAVVSEPSRKFLWVLSRTPQLPAGTMDGIKSRLTAKGFDVGKLQFTAQGTEVVK